MTTDTTIKATAGVTNNTYAAKNSDLTEKTNDSYSYIITNFKNFNY
jgi:hypothetical protein